MAQRVVVQLLDDVDGSEADETVSFGLDGHEYEIDLSQPNATNLREALRPWASSARVTSRPRGRKPQTPRPQTTTTTARPATAPKITVLPDVRPYPTHAERGDLRRFALANGMKPPGDRGRVSAALLEAWTAAGRPSGR